jgi:hypothetical protein
MVETISPDVLWKPFNVLVGGLGSLNIRRMTNDESKDLDRFVEDSVDALDKISPEVAKDFKAQAAFFKSVGEVLMGKVDKAFGGVLPSPGQVGVSLLEPRDIRYVATPSSTYPAYSDYTLNKWELSLTAGSTIHILGDGSNYFKPRPTELYRCAIAIMKSGVIEVGTSPSLSQFRLKTEKITYPYLTVHPLVDQPIEEGYTIYRYNLPFGIPMFYDFGVMFDALPRVTKTSDVRLIGVVFYEYGHKESLTWVS